MLWKANGSALNSTSGTRCGRLINIVIPDSCDRWRIWAPQVTAHDKSASHGFTSPQLSTSLLPELSDSMHRLVIYSPATSASYM